MKALGLCATAPKSRLDLEVEMGLGRDFDSVKSVEVADWDTDVTDWEMEDTDVTDWEMEDTDVIDWEMEDTNVIDWDTGDTN